MAELHQMVRMDESVTIDLAQQRALGLHILEYADRNDLSLPQVRELLHMIGL